MKIHIIYFSPTGNTRTVATALSTQLNARSIEVSSSDITGCRQIFEKGDHASFLQQSVPEHDVLLVGAPVYAHHFQYHMLELIRALPKADEKKWGRITLPFVTYGGIESGIALEEAAQALKKSGRIVIGGLKISTSHHFISTVLQQPFNHEKPEGLAYAASQTAALVQGAMSEHVREDRSTVLRNKSRIDKLKADIIFNEKKWHAKRYPKLTIDTDKCTNCGACVRSCPVLHFEGGKSHPHLNNRNQCIHCMKCHSVCPGNAIKINGDLERAREFIRSLVDKKGNSEQPENFLYK